MKQRGRRGLSILLTLCLLLGLSAGLAVPAAAAELPNTGGILSEDTYTLTGNVKLETNNLTINSGNVTIDLAGYTLTGTGNGSVITVNGGTLTLKDDTGSGKITGGNIADDDGAWQCGGGVTVNGGTFIMNGGTITSNTAANGAGGVNVYNGSFTMNGGTISDNTATGNAAGGLSVYGTANIGSGAIISGNTAANSGAGISIASDGSVTMSGGTITDNQANIDGGGVFIDVNGNFTMSDGSITGNTAGSAGGGVNISGGTFTMSGGTITGNKAIQNGGGVTVADYPNSAIQVSGNIEITGNTLTSGAASNVWLSAGKTITNNNLTGGSIGVSVHTLPGDGETVPVLTGGTNASLFSSDEDGYVLEAQNGTVVLKAEGTSIDPNGNITRAELAEKIQLHEPFGLSGRTSGSASIFTDLTGKVTDTQYNAIGVLCDQKILSGTTANTFSPDGTVTRAQAAVVIWRAAGSPSNKESITVPYKDIDTTLWYSPAIHSLYAMGVLDDTDMDTSKAFRINDPATRADIEKWLFAYTAAWSGSGSGGSLEGIVVPGGASRADFVLSVYNVLSQSNRVKDEEEEHGTPFVDIADCTPQQQEAITYFYSIEVISGTTETTFDPYAPASNAQVAKFLEQLSAALGEDFSSAAATAFSLPPANWYASAVNFLVAEGVLTQEEARDENFNPHAPSFAAKIQTWSQGLKPAAPTVSPAGGQYTSAQAVTLSAPDGLTIHYTTDGTIPTRDSAVYTTPISVTKSTTIKAMAAGDGLSSDVVTASYTIGSSGGGSSSGSDDDNGYTPPVTTEKNPDGSTTTNTIKNDGTKVETTKYPDGSKEVVETAKDGTVTTTETSADGSKTETVQNPNGSSETTVEQADGSGSTTSVAADGTVTARAALSEGAVAAAQAAGEPAALPMPEVPVTADRTSAPTVTVSLPAGSGSARVEIPVENVTAGTVAVLVKSDGTEEVIKTSLTTENGVTVTLSHGDTVKIVDNSKSFADVPASYWGSDAVTFAASREIFNGTGPDTFSPDTAMSRGMIVTVLARFEGVDTSAGENWYDAGAAWAVEQGISDGANLDQPLTREQLATMLYRYAGSPAAGSPLSGYPDTASVSGYAADAMAWAVENGLIGGTGAGTLNPRGLATRTEVATILMRFCQNRT